MPSHSLALRLRQLAALSVLLCGSTALGMAQPATPDLGTIVRVSTVRRSAAGTPRRNAGEGLLIRSRGTKQRVDVLRSAHDTVGTDWITTGAQPREMRIHNVARRSTLVMRFADLQTLFTSLMRTQFDSASADAEVLGAGPRLLGHDTQRVRFTRRFRMQTSRAGKTQVMRVTSEIDALIAPTVPESYGANSALSLTSGSTADLVEQIFGAGASRMVVKGDRPLPTGLALRSVSRSRVESSGSTVFPIGEGDISESVDSVEVLSIERALMDDELFAEPVGHEVVDFGEQLQKLVTMMDTLSSSLEEVVRTGKPVKGAKPLSKPVSKPTSKPSRP